jgi:hypothetical protein
MYNPKMVFLMSDENWEDVLPFVSASTWTDSSGNIDAYPVLIYHNDTIDSVDSTSIINFMQQYSPSEVIQVSDSPQQLDDLLFASPPIGEGLQQNQIQEINPQDYLNYWNSFNSVVYVQDNYTLALMASTYASLINAPLIIQGSSLDSPSIFSGRNVICIENFNPVGVYGNVYGNVNVYGIPLESSYCSETYNLQQLQSLYIQQTNTNKIMLINPTDWDTGETIDEGLLPPFYIPEELFFKTSLVSPFLASAKHELLFSTTETSDSAINSALKTETNSMNAQYLTIMASPLVIPNSQYMNTIQGYPIYRSLDQTEYGAKCASPSILGIIFPSMGGSCFGSPSIFTGRIMGFTTSDVSTYVARDLFYSGLQKTNNAIFMASSFQDEIDDANNLASELRSVGYNAASSVSSQTAANFDPSLWNNQDLISYADHGDPYWAGIASSEIPPLNSSLVFANACSTCSTQDPYSFCNTAIEQGSIGFFGAVSVAFDPNDIYRDTINNLYGGSVALSVLLRVGSGKITVGQAFTVAYDSNLQSKPEDIQYLYMTTFIGDPTFQISLPTLPTFKNYGNPTPPAGNYGNYGNAGGDSGAS